MIKKKKDYVLLSNRDLMIFFFVIKLNSFFDYNLKYWYFCNQKLELVFFGIKFKALMFLLNCISLSTWI